MKYARRVLAILLCIMQVCSFAACGSKRAEEKPWLKSSKTDSQAETFSQVVRENDEGSEGTLASESTLDSAAPSSAPEAREVSEEDKQQSIYWNGVGTSFYHQFVSDKYAVEAWMKAMELNPKNITPYLHVVNVAAIPDDAGMEIPEYTKVMKRFHKSLLSSGLEKMSLSDKEETTTLDFDRTKNCFTLLRERGQEERVLLTFLFSESGVLTEWIGEWSNIRQTYTFQYDKKEQLTSVLVKNDYYMYSIEYMYSYNETGQLIKALEHHEEYAKNDESQKEKTNEYTDENTYEYNTDGMLERVIYPTRMSDGTAIVRKTDYSYDTQGRIVQEAFGNANAESDTVYSYKYDDKGRLVETALTKSESGHYFTDTYGFDNRGWLCTISRSDNDGDSEETITLDDHGNREMEEKNTYDADENPTHAWGYDIEYTFAE